MASILAISVYGLIAGLVLLNSIMETDDHPLRARHLAIMLAVAMAWPAVALVLPALAKGEAFG